MLENTNMFNNKILKILIDEKKDSVTFFIENGNVLSTKLSNILSNRKEIFKTFRISQKCHELTTSFIKRRKLEKLLNPAIIEGLNDNMDIMQYIRCVKNKSKLFFELEHITEESSLNFRDKLRMKNIAKHESRLGAKVDGIDGTILNEVKSKIKNKAPKETITNKEPLIISEKEVDIKCDKAYEFLISYFENFNGNIKNIKDLESIEYKLKTAINWYIKNQKNDKAFININRYKRLLDNERKYYYEPRILKQCEKSERDLMIKDLEALSIKNYELQKLRIRNLLSKGKVKEAEQLYKDTLDVLGIKLTKKELKKSLKDGIEYGYYYTQLRRGFRRVQIKGTERVLENIEYLENLNKQPENTEQKSISKNDTKEDEKETKKIEKKYTKEEITNIMQKCDKFSDKINFQKGAIIPVIDALISYLSENKENDVKEYLNNILIKINEIEPIDLMKSKDGKENKYNTLIFDYISNLYKNGVKNIDGENIINCDERKYAYYMYLLNRRIEDDLGTKVLLSSDRIKAIKDEYSINSEEIELSYFEELLDRNAKKTTGFKNKLLKNEKYSKAILDLENNSKNEVVRFLALSEDLKNGVYRKRVGLPTNLKMFTDLRDIIHKKIDSKDLLNPRLLKIIGNIEDAGIYDKLNNEVVKPDKNEARKIYGCISEETKKINIDSKEQTIDNENTEQSVNQIQKIEKQKSHKGLFKKLQKNKTESQMKTKPINNESNLYVCSDLHGQFELYKTIISQLKEGDKLYILGDVIDRGPDGIRILQDILQRQEQIELFVGNHELMMIQSLFIENEKEKQNWIREANGGRKTYEDFLKLSIEDQEKIKDLLLQSTVHREITVNGEDIYLVHAKADKLSDKKKETVEEYLTEHREKELYDSVWARVNDTKENDSSEVWQEDEIGKDNIFTVIGHTPTDNNKIEVHDNYAIIDCGATNYGNGCLLRLNDGTTVYFDNVTRCIEQLKNEEER